MIALLGIAFMAVGYIIVGIFTVAGGIGMSMMNKSSPPPNIQQKETKKQEEMIVVHKRYRIVDVRNKLNVLASCDDAWEALDLKDQFRKAGYIVMVKDVEMNDSNYRRGGRK